MKLILEVTVTTEPGRSFGALRFSAGLQKLLSEQIEQEGVTAIVNVQPVAILESGKALE